MGGGSGSLTRQMLPLPVKFVSGNQFVDNWSDLVLSGRDSGTRWTVDGRGNYWSRYRGFDFDGDGIGDAPHPLDGAFERLEGANPAARLFLQSPAAAGLELAARLSGRAAERMYKFG